MKNLMRSLAVLCCAVMAFALISCDKDNEKMIVGTWDVQYQTAVYEGEDSTRIYPCEAGEIWYYGFNEDNTGYISHTYEPGDTDYMDFTYSVSDNILSITHPEYPVKGATTHTNTIHFLIEKMTKNELVLLMLNRHDLHRTYLKKR